MDRRWTMAAGALTMLAVALGSTPASAAISTQDRGFVRNAAQAGLSEVAEARLALQKAVDPATRNFAQRMIDDHTAANQRLSDIADREGFIIPSQPDANQRLELSQLQGLDGRRFDRVYINDQVAAHRAAVSLFRTESNLGTNAHLRRFATATLPTLREHQQMSVTVAANLNGGRGGRFAHRRFMHGM